MWHVLKRKNGSFLLYYSHKVVQKGEGASTAQPRAACANGCAEGMATKQLQGPPPPKSLHGPPSLPSTAHRVLQNHPQMEPMEAMPHTGNVLEKEC